MKKVISILTIAVLIALMSVFASAVSIAYVSENGYGNGMSADKPTNSFDRAINLLEQGGTLVITDSYTFYEPYYEPEHSGEITITGGTMIFEQTDYTRYYLSGPVKFENITFAYGSNNQYKSAAFMSRFNPVEFGKGIVNSANISMIIVGGYMHPIMSGDNMSASDIVTDYDSHITVNSGTFRDIIGFSRGVGSVSYTGTSNITINGGTVTNIFGASGNGSYSGSTNIVINGGKVTNLNTGGDSTRRLNGDAKITVNDGSVKNLKINNVMGHTDVFYLGGSIETASVSIANGLEEFVVDGTTSLVVRKGLHATAFYEVFDEAKYEDGSALSGANDFDVAAYTVLDKVPTEITAYPAKVYVANVGDGTGLSPDSPVSDWETAYSLLEGVDGTIVLINEIYVGDAHFYEPEHDNKIVITSFDGERYYDGGINTGKAKRFYFGGDTTIENTKIMFESSSLYVCNFHNVTFGVGLDTPATGDLYALAGHQFATKGTVSENIGSTLTIKSGRYYCVMGYTRGIGTDYTFKGTQTLNLLGGDIRRVYGGVVQANKSDRIVINVDGAKISDFIQLGGDQWYHSNNAVVNMKSGYIKQLDMRNVLETTVVNWTGGDIDAFACDNCMYNGVLNEEAYAAANEYKDAIYILNYLNVTPTDAHKAFFTSVGEIVRTEVKLTIGSTTAYINGVAQTLDASPINRNNRTMLPVRFLANAFGVPNDGIAWDGVTRTATLKNSEVTIVVTIDKPTMTVNGSIVKLDSPAIIENDRTYLPVRAIANALGVSNDDIAWDGATSTATLIK